jgi:pimeloyl-ACP methyl ester carboxylesterase
VTRLGGLKAHRVDGTNAGDGPTVLLVHGFGQGAWIWSRDQALLAAAGHASVSVDLPGHGADAGSDADFDALVAGLVGAVAELDAPVLVGLGGGALVAQVVAERANLTALVLINPLPSGDVRLRPDMAGAQALLGALPSVLSGGVELSLDAASSTALSAVPDGERADVHDRTAPWPGGLVRSLIRRPQVTPTGVPTLVLTGLQDHVVPANVSRLVGDYFNAVTWRFDDVGHLPPLEPAGERLTGALIDWLRKPLPRKVLEVHAFQPGEGVGDDARDARRPKRSTRSNSRFKAVNRALERARAFKGGDDSRG